jgi:hypothetical protein
MPEKWIKRLGWTACGIGFVVWILFAFFALPAMNSALFFAFKLQPLSVGTVIAGQKYMQQSPANHIQLGAVVIELQFTNPNKKATPAKITQTITVTGTAARALDAQGLLQAGAAIPCTLDKHTGYAPASETTSNLIAIAILGGGICGLVFAMLAFFQIWIGFKTPDLKAKWTMKYHLAGGKVISGGYPITGITLFLGYFVILGFLTWFINSISPAEFTSASGMRIPDVTLLLLLLYTAGNFGFLGLKKP